MKYFTLVAALECYAQDGGGRWPKKPALTTASSNKKGAGAGVRTRCKKSAGAAA
jgi:hypothetical protein